MPVTFQTLIQADASREQIEDFCRQRAQVMTAGNVNLCRVLGKYLMYVLPQDNAITPHLALNGIWEPWVTMAIARHVKPGMRCLDVGACYGYYALLMADLVGEEGQVDAWEPVWSELLLANINLNGLAVGMFPFAMGTASGEVSLLFAGRDGLSLFNAGASRATELLTANSDSPERVDAEMCQPMGAAYDFIKMDVGASTPDAWRALRFSRFEEPVTVCLELGPETDAHAVLSEISEAGFALNLLHDDGLPRACSVADALAWPRVLWLTKG